MLRRSPILLAVFLAGCGGGGGLLATVPPPVEFATRPMGANELPGSGLRPGTLTVERVVATKRVGGGYDYEIMSSSDPVAVEAEIAEDGTIALRKVGERTPLFSGRLVAVTGDAPQTYADLRAFDGNAEKFPYSYWKNPFALDIVARTRATKRGQTYEFDRYVFEITK